MQAERSAAGWFCRYKGDGQSDLWLEADPATQVLNLEARTRLDAPLYSHLNHFTHVVASGHQALSLEFSPCPGHRISVEPFDYPFGRLLRLAYLGADGVFTIAEARDAEKGPYRVLASGRLERSAPLAITFLDGQDPVCRLTLRDWAAQVSTALSPSAGWGLPVNAIQFHRRSDAPESSCDLFVTLAATGVGRGFDSVGHGPGTYRNRLRIEAARR